MDDTICQFSKQFKKELTDDNQYPHSRKEFFLELEPLPDALEALKELGMFYDLYILTRPSIYNTHCYSEKAEWIKKHLGFDMLNKLILSPDKSLLKGDFLVDDACYDGQTEFEGAFIRFGTEEWPDWKTVKRALVDCHFGRDHEINLPVKTLPSILDFIIQPRLLQYHYKYDCQGTDEWGIGNALVFAPNDASFNNVRSVLVNEKSNPQHDIDIDSIIDLTIQYK